MMRMLSDVKASLEASYKELGTWRLVGEEHGISAAIAWQIVHKNFKPRSTELRTALGLGDLSHHHIDCPECGASINYDVAQSPCPYCNEAYIITGSHFDHIVPRIRGGTDDDWNLVQCCQECNLVKHDRTPWEWLGENWLPPDGQELQFAYAYAFRKETLNA